MYEPYSILISIVALGVSMINLVLYYRYTKRTTGAAIKHELTELPPYRSKDDLTTIKVTNVGNAVANIESTCLEFSWDKDLTIDLNNECEEGYSLMPNEDKIFHKRLPDPPSGSHVIKITTMHDGLPKKDEFPISVAGPAFIFGSR